MPNHGNGKKSGRPAGLGKAAGSGRKKGTPNKKKEWGPDIAAILDELDCCPFTGMAQIGMKQIDCYECAGAGEQEYILTEDSGFVCAPNGQGATVMTCMRCKGEGLEPIDVGVRNRAFSELAQYLAPKRKAIETTNKQLVGVVVKDYRGQGGGMIEAQESEIIDATASDLITVKVD